MVFLERWHYLMLITIGYRAKANLDSDGLRFIFSEDGMLLSLKYHISVLVVGISHMRFPPMAFVQNSYTLT